MQRHEHEIGAADGQFGIGLDLGRAVDQHDVMIGAQPVELAGEAPAGDLAVADWPLCGGSERVPPGEAALRVGIEHGHAPRDRPGGRQSGDQHGLAGAALLLRHGDHIRHAIILLLKG